MQYDDMKTELRICPGGKLFRKVWVKQDTGQEEFWKLSDETNTPVKCLEGFWKLSDVTNTPFKFLMYSCDLDSQVTLRDVFTLLEENIEFFNLVLDADLTSYIAESKKPSVPSNAISYLELYWQINSGDEYSEGFEFPNFHGISKDSEKLAIDFSPINTLIDLPLMLQPDAELVLDAHSVNYKTVVLRNVPFTLLDILYGIVWELTFHGSPTRRDEALDKIKQSVRDSIEHPENLISFDFLRE